MEHASRAQVSAELFGVLARIVHRTAQDAAAVLRRDGLSPAQFQLLRAVGQSPGVTQAELGLHRGITPGGVSQLVTKLEAAALVRRDAEGAANRLWLTDAGRSLVDRLTPDQDDFFARRFAGLDQGQLHAFREVATLALDQLPQEADH
jgi:DNA-binding MarR family transcriptional regulator